MLVGRCPMSGAQRVPGLRQVLHRMASWRPALQRGSCRMPRRRVPRQQARWAAPQREELSFSADCGAFGPQAFLPGARRAQLGPPLRRAAQPPAAHGYFRWPVRLISLPARRSLSLRAGRLLLLRRLLPPRSRRFQFPLQHLLFRAWPLPVALRARLSRRGLWQEPTRP
mgnify:CR=1 FL=1